jgi:glucosamine--fructose-6-phosphate aminotransferase (isomerizing)
MCGIYGTILGRDADGGVLTIQKTLHGLANLQYRGYDSAGIAFQPLPITLSTNTSIHKVVGDVSDLELLLASCYPDGTGATHLAISHTRWATNGKPSLMNAHPIHYGDESNSFVVVHNGIITNAGTLFEELRMLGFEPSTDTDTEVVPMLCSMLYRAHPCTSFRALLEKVCAMLEGSFAMLIISSNFPERMVACKKGSPLHVGVAASGKRIILSSDIVPLTRERDPLDIFTLRDGTIFEFSCSDLSEDGKVISTFGQRHEEVTHDGVSLSTSSLGIYESYLEKEICQQPQTLRASISRFIDADKQISFKGVDATAKSRIHQARYIVLIGCGTSLHACIACKDLFRKHCSDKLVFVESASSFCEESLPLTSSDVCIFVSQSGETADTIAALQLAKEKGAFCCAITNQANSTIALGADKSIYLGIGDEISVASTKAYTSQLCTMIMLVNFLSDMPTITINELMELPEALDACLPELDITIKNLARYVIDFHHVLIVGCACDLATCMEGALKIKEVPYIHAEAILAGELKHGPLALIDDNVLVLVVATSANVNNGKIMLAIDQLVAREAHVVVVTTEPLIHQFNVSRIIKTPRLSDRTLQRVIDIVPFQLLALHLAGLKNINIDRPRNLAKSVTVA